MAHDTVVVSINQKKTFIGGEKNTVNKVLTYRNRKAANPTSVYLHFTAFLIQNLDVGAECMILIIV